MRVFVLSREGYPLMPTTPRRARLWLKARRARVVRRDPFTIQLRFETTSYTQPVTVGVDTGSQAVGLAALANGEVLVQAEVHLRTDISVKLAQRRTYRRARRSRTTRYRPARWANRRRKAGWLPPSVCSKLHATGQQNCCRIWLSPDPGSGAPPVAGCGSGFCAQDSVAHPAQTAVRRGACPGALRLPDHIPPHPGTQPTQVPCPRCRSHCLCRKGSGSALARVLLVHALPPTWQVSTVQRQAQRAHMLGSAQGAWVEALRTGSGQRTDGLHRRTAGKGGICAQRHDQREDAARDHAPQTGTGRPSHAGLDDHATGSRWEQKGGRRFLPQVNQGVPAPPESWI